MIVIHCEFYVDPNDRDAWIESAVRTATISRSEVGCLSYQFSFDVAEPNIAYAYEVWASQEDLDAHMAAPHHAIRLRELEAWNIVRREAVFYGIEWARDFLAEQGAAASSTDLGSA